MEHSSRPDKNTFRRYFSFSKFSIKLWLSASSWAVSNLWLMDLGTWLGAALSCWDVKVSMSSKWDVMSDILKGIVSHNYKRLTWAQFTLVCCGKEKNLMRFYLRQWNACHDLYFQNALLTLEYIPSQLFTDFTAFRTLSGAIGLIIVVLIFTHHTHKYKNKS